jgi:hypothetical protein
VAGQHPVAGQLAHFLRVAGHVDTDFWLESRTVKAAATGGEKKYAAARAEGGAIEHVAVVVDLRTGEVASVRRPLVDEALPFLGKHVHPDAAALFSTRERDTVRLLKKGQSTHVGRA